MSRRDWLLVLVGFVVGSIGGTLGMSLPWIIVVAIVAGQVARIWIGDEYR